MDTEELTNLLMHLSLCDTHTAMSACVNKTVVCGFLKESGTSRIEWVGCRGENKRRGASVSHVGESVCVFVQECSFTDKCRTST